jgi:hypothetical protein
MPPRKSKSDDKEPAASQEGGAVIPTARLPPPLRFPLLVALSLTLSSISYTLAARYTAEELASVSRKLDQWWEVAALVGWRMCVRAWYTCVDIRAD